MSYAKRRIAVFLSMLIMLTTVFGLVPAKSVKAATGNVIVGWNGSGYDEQNAFQVKKGAADLYIGDYISVSISAGGNYTDYGYLSNNSGVTYTSANPSVVSVDNKTGKMTVKGLGLTTISITFKGHQHTVYVKGVKDLSKELKQSLSWRKSEGDKYAAAFVKAYGKGITTANRYKLLNIYKKAGYFSSGYTTSYSSSRECGIYDGTAGHAHALANNLYKYAEEKMNPFATKSAKVFNIQKISGKGQQITVTLNSKVTADQIYGAQYEKNEDTDVKEVSTFQFPIYVKDLNSGHRYYAVATIKKGSKTMTIKTKNLKLKKGSKYCLMDSKYYPTESDTWLTNSKVYKFTAK